MIKFIYWFILLCIFFLVAIFSLRLIEDTDLGFHLRGGEWISEHKSFHHKDVFTYTVNERDYIAMQWLYQVVIYSIFRFFGYAGLSIMNALLILVVFYLIFLRMKKSNLPQAGTIIALLLAVFALEIRFTLRPEVLSWIFILLTLLIMDAYFYRRKNYLPWLMPIQFLWVNCHGLFILGWIISGIYFLSLWLHRKKIDTTCLKWFLLSMLATCLNPYGLKGIIFPLELLRKLQGADVFKNAISELKSPWAIAGSATQTNPFYPVVPLYLYYLISILTFISLIVARRKYKLQDYLLGISFFYLSYTAVRNTPLFIFIALPIMVIALRDVFLTRSLSKIIPLTLIVGIIVFSFRVVNNAYYIADRRTTKFGIGLDRYRHPVDAAKFLAKNKLNARILNDFNSGSWLIWKGPQPVFIDGRAEVMQEVFFKEYQDSFTRGGLQKIIGKYRPQLIFFDHLASLRWDLQLRAMPDWRLIYCDETSAIYARADYALDYPAVNFIDIPPERGIAVNLRDAAVWEMLKQPRPMKFSYWLSGFFRKQAYPYNELMRLGFFAYQNNAFKTAEAFYLEFLKKTRGTLYEAYFNLGSLYYRAKDYPKAIYCYEVVLKEYPENKLANQRYLEITRKLEPSPQSQDLKFYLPY